MKDKDLVEILENLGYSILSSPKILKHTEIKDIKSITFSADSKYLITSYDYGTTVGIWSIPYGKLIKSVEDKQLEPNKDIESPMVISSNGKYLAYELNTVNFLGLWKKIDKNIFVT
jgi:WD40 repeat protein